jgi:hypothetical protein
MTTARAFYERGCVKFTLTGEPNMVTNKNKELFPEFLP